MPAISKPVVLLMAQRLGTILILMNMLHSMAILATAPLPRTANMLHNMAILHKVVTLSTAPMAHNMGAQVMLNQVVMGGVQHQEAIMLIWLGASITKMARKDTTRYLLLAQRERDSFSIKIEDIKTSKSFKSQVLHPDRCGPSLNPMSSSLHGECTLDSQC